MRYWKRFRRVARRQSVDDAVEVLQGRAQFHGRCHEVAVRVGYANGYIYVDLCDDAWRAVEISRKGWKLVSNPPVRFVRRNGMLALPEPKRSGSLHHVGRVLPVDPVDVDIVVAFLVGAMMPRGPYPVLVFHGPEGSGKSMAAQLVRAVIDPNAAPLRGQPKTEQDLMISAIHSRLIALDNLSSMPKGLADGLCRLTKGAGHSARAQYTDADEYLLAACRPVIINGIPFLLSRVDLAERALAVDCPAMSSGQRRSEAEIMAEFADMHPQLLGALFDALAGALRREREVSVAELPRLADFARWCEAAARELGWQPGAISRRIIEHQAGVRRAAVERDPFARAVLDLAKAASAWSPGWKGTCTELLRALDAAVPVAERGDEWPTTPEGTRKRLNRVLPLLERLGLRAQFRRGSAPSALRLVTLTMHAGRAS